MKSKTFKVLIVNNHPLIYQAYKTALTQYTRKQNNVLFCIEIAVNSDEAITFLTNFHKDKKKIDFIFLDIGLPPSKNGKLLSGEDLGIKIRALIPESKIVVSTSFDNNYRIHSIFKSINPEVFLINKDVTSNVLNQAIDVVINDPPFYSKTVLKLLRNQVTNDFLLDDLDRRILYELSMGAKMKELPEIMPLSMAAIEKRKRQLNEIFNVKNQEIRELILVAKKKVLFRFLFTSKSFFF